jgi:hypothetical protein
MVSQLTQITSDGRPSEDAQFDCVPASIGAGILYLLGKSQWDTAVNPDLLKDAAYGENWKNMGTAASAYVPICQKLGFNLRHLDGTPSALVSEAHNQLSTGHPVIFTEPDPYVSASLGWSHVCVFYSEAPGLLTAMDPYIARPVQRTDQEWEGLLEFNQIWVLEKLDVSIDIHTPGMSNDFEELDAHHWRRKSANSSGGHPVIQFGLLENYKKYGNSGLCGRQFLGLPESGEITLGPNKVKQYYQFGCLCWDNGKIYPLAVYDESSPGHDPLIDALKKQYELQTAIPAQLLVNALNQIKAIVAKV